MKFDTALRGAAFSRAWSSVPAESSAMSMRMFFMGVENEEADPPDHSKRTHGAFGNFSRAASLAPVSPAKPQCATFHAPSAELTQMK